MICYTKILFFSLFSFVLISFTNNELMAEKLRVEFKQFDGIFGCANKNGDMIATEKDDQIRVWSIKTESLISTINDEYAISINDRGDKIATVGTDENGRHIVNYGRVWSINTGKLLYAVNGRPLFFVGDKLLVVENDRDTRTAIYSEDGKLIRKFNGYYGGLHNGKTLLETCADETCAYMKHYVWSLETGSLLYEFDKRGNGICYLEFNKQCDKIVFYDGDITTVYDKGEKGDLRSSWKFKGALRINKEGNRGVLQKGINKSLEIYDIQTGEMIYYLDNEEVFRSFNPQGNLLVTDNLIGRITFWSLNKKEAIATFSDSSLFCFNECGDKIITYSWNNHQIKIWSIKTGSLICSFDKSFSFGHIICNNFIITQSCPTTKVMDLEKF